MDATTNPSCVRDAFRTMYALLAVGVVGVILGGVSSPAVADDAETKSSEPATYTVVRASVAPIVDGMTDDRAWTNAKEGRLEWNVDTATPWTDNRDFQGTFRAVWREGQIYVRMTFTDNRFEMDTQRPELSDRIKIFLPKNPAPQYQSYTVPLRGIGSLEDPAVPFIAWASDGKSCEFSIESNAMAQRGNVQLINFYYEDVDDKRLRHRIGWVPASPGGRDPQYGVFSFEGGADPRSKRQTTWGRIKSLY